MFKTRLGREVGDMTYLRKDAPQENQRNENNCAEPLTEGRPSSATDPQRLTNERESKTSLHGEIDRSLWCIHDIQASNKPLGTSEGKNMRYETRESHR
jgi:hypothetical protein